jgi:hypothetical protein
MQVKAFPWPAQSLDLGGVVAAALLTFLLVFAFQQPTRAMVAVLVAERERGLRGHMRVLGLRDGAYWGSWLATHGAMLAVTGVLCAAIGTCAPRRLCILHLLLAKPSVGAERCPC